MGFTWGGREGKSKNMFKIRLMFISKLLKYYSLQFIIIPATFVCFALQGEDTNTILFASSLATVVSLALYFYDLLITLLLSRLIREDSIILFLIPIIIMLVFSFEIQKLITYLDFGGDYFIYIVLISSFSINVITFYSLKRQS